MSEKLTNKRLEKNHNLALTYCVYANIISIIPILLIGQIIYSFSEFWLQLVLNLILFTITMYYSFKWAGNYINNNYYVPSVKALTRWSLGYIVMLGIVLILFDVSRADAILEKTVIFVTDISIRLLVIYFLTAKFVQQTPNEVIAKLGIQSLSKKDAVKKVIKQVAKLVALIVAGIILLLVVPVFVYFNLIDAFSLSAGKGLLIVALWEILVILLAFRYVKFE